MNSEIEISHNDLALCESELKDSSVLVSVIGYVRIASCAQDEDHVFDAQVSAIRQLCEKRLPEGCRIIWVTDKGASGNMSWQRPGLQPGHYRTGLTLVTQLIERGYVRYVCVERFHRLTRSSKLSQEFKNDYLDRHDVQLLSATEPIEVAKGQNQHWSVV